MSHQQVSPVIRIVAALAVLVVVDVLIRTLVRYADYFPPDFTTGFLVGREGHFFGTYSAAFYAHIAAGPVVLLLGLFLIHPWSRDRIPGWHRLLGRVQAIVILLVVVPSGLVMARHAAAGPIGGMGLALLALATAVCTLLGVRAARKGNFATHRRWMWRTYLLLCSTVVLRLTIGLASIYGMDDERLQSAVNWLSWLVPLGLTFLPWPLPTKWPVAPTQVGNQRARSRPTQRPDLSEARHRRVISLVQPYPRRRS